MRNAIDALFISNTSPMRTRATPNGTSSAMPGTWVAATNRCSDKAMVWSNTLCGRKGVKNTAPVNMIGAVSPAVRETSRITPVRMPVIEFGSTTLRMVCQRVAPMFQQASRNASGTDCSDSRVATMTTGMVITASVMLAARMLVPNLKKMTKAPSPNRACTIDGTPARLMIARLITRVNQLSPAYSLR
jgi:hypothetical protein